MDPTSWFYTILTCGTPLWDIMYERVRFGTVVLYFVRELQCERAINRNIDTSLCEADEQGEHGE